MFRPCCERSNYQMSKTQNVILRVTIVLGMIVAVVAVLYLSPLPEQYFKSCDRPCHDLDWPMICRIKIQLETLQDVRVCDDNSCLSNTSLPSILVNRQSPGPPIQICENDILVVDIVNKIPGHTVSMHWRGQPNNEAPHMDGSPLITQCPILSYTTFQYKFRVTAPGTHLYHAHSTSDRTKGVFGALIVRQSEKKDLLKKHFDRDLKEHIVLISENQGKILINGKPSEDETDLSIFEVKPNKRYRFRVAFAASSSNCPLNISIDNHPVKIIALDGSPTHPHEAHSVVLGVGERADFVLRTTQVANAYFLRATSCRNKGLALVNYGKQRSDYSVEEGRALDSSLCESQLGRVCLGDVKAMEKMPVKLRQRDKALFLSFGSRAINVNGKFSARIFNVNNLTFTYPPSPLLTQIAQVPSKSLCHELDFPQKCLGQEVCECVHIEYIPLESVTELILVNQDQADEEHVFHLHGYRFYVVGFRQFESAPTQEEVKLLDQEGVLFKRNFNNPIIKDTIRVPRNGAVALRFIANNPGFWMLRDEKSGGWTRGMDVVLQVGDYKDFPSTPADFPMCGNYIGPDFFLM